MEDERQKRSPAAKSVNRLEQTPRHPRTGDAVHWRARLYTEHFYFTRLERWVYH